MDERFRTRHVTIHGHEVGYRRAGRGTPIVLLHGLAGSSRTWKDVMPALAERHDVIAPDLLGHGESAKPLGDYSLGAHASGVRDLLEALDVPSATVVGHSLGGGIALQFAYQYPERCDRLVLVGAGGLGREVSWLLRALHAAARRAGDAGGVPALVRQCRQRRQSLPRSPRRAQPAPR